MNSLAAVLLLVLVAGCGGGTGDAAAEGPTTLAADGSATPRAVRVLVLGDSFAVGEGIDSDGAWPAQLAAALRPDGYQAKITIIGGTGWTARRVADAASGGDLVGSFDLVVVAVGVNDHFYQFGADHLRTQVDAILARIAPLVADPGDVIMLSAVDWRATPRGAEYAATWRDTPVAPYNDVLEDAAAGAGHRYLDVTTASLAMADDPSLVAPDGLHGSGVLYARWVELLLPMATAALGEPPSSGSLP